MGVKDLWSILSPVGQKSTLHDLEGKTVAVDLSGWICENQQIGEKYDTGQPRMYLRNLFFRTSILLMMNITPVFVMDGEAPLLKADTIAARNAAQGKSSNSKGGSRRRLKGLLRQCQEFLKTLGLTCVQGSGEAEATCAQLDMAGLVDGVITQDGDTFLYGGKTVYRNFTIQGSSGSIEVYRIEDIVGKLSLTREKLVALSLLCGCDYDRHGVVGVGKETAFRFLENLEGSALHHIRGWRTNKMLVKYEEQRGACAMCSHTGKPREHVKTGCAECHTLRGCIEDTDPTSYRNLTQDRQKAINLELGLRRKAIVNEHFPNEDMIVEYLGDRLDQVNVKAQWDAPAVISFVRFAGKMLNWEPEYSLEKILPISVRWSLLNNPSQYSLVEIVKKRVLRGIACFEVLWSVEDELVAGLLEGGGTFTTVEPQQFIINAFPQVSESFIKSKEKKKNPKKSKKEKTKQENNKENIDDLTNAISQISLETSDMSLRDFRLQECRVLCESQGSSEHVESTQREHTKKSLSLEDEFTQRIRARMAKEDLLSVCEHKSDRVDDNVADGTRYETDEGCDNSLIQSHEENNIGIEYSLLDDSATIDYEFDVSLLVDQIVSRKRFY